MNIQELNLNSLELRYANLRVRRPLAEKRLLASLGETGQHSPVVVVAASEAGRYVVIDGYKRVRAMSKLKADVVKAAVWEMSAEQALVTAYQMASGSGWNAVEEGWLVWELVRVAGLSESQAGRRLERSKGWVSGRLGLIEILPEAVLEGVRSGKIGAYTATRHLLPFARANAADCESLAVKIVENGFRSREVETLCRYYGSAGREGRRRMLEDPARFLKALESTRYKDAGSQGPEELRCLKSLELIGNVSLGLARSLPAVAGSDTATAARERLQPAWDLARRRWAELLKTAAAVFVVCAARPAADGGADRSREALAHAG
jgi:ParB family transcriptional regulator, chromosome partitioning protein